MQLSSKILHVLYFFNTFFFLLKVLLEYYTFYMYRSLKTLLMQYRGSVTKTKHVQSCYGRFKELCITFRGIIPIGGGG